MEKTNPDNELLRDVYASQLLVTRAKQAGFLAEPAVINLASDEEYYTLFVLHLWLIQHAKMYVHISCQTDYVEPWSADVYATHPDDEEQYYCNGLVNKAMELGFHNTYQEALEAGLNYAYSLIPKPK